MAVNTASAVGGDARGGIPPFWRNRAVLGRGLVSLGVITVCVVLAMGLHGTSGRGAPSSFSLMSGLLFGILLERGRFCFYCILRDFIVYRNSSPLLSVVTALAVGGVGYVVVFETFLANPMAGRLPPDAHIGPVSWATVLAGLAFGVGMALSGACLSGHLYRLGEGYARAPIALFGSLIGFGLGFLTWQTFYQETIANAPIAWLPATFGYTGALVVHLLVLGAIALWLLRYLPPLKPSEGGRVTLASLYDTVFVQRWNPLLTGALVGVLGVFAYLRVEPLGVTAQLGSVSRTFMHDMGWLDGRLNGLDRFAGCATVVVQAITDNGLFVGALVAGSFAMALLANKFQVSRLTVKNSATALLGGVLMGWGAMLALGCTVGTLLSGISAFALSGWVFAGATFLGVWLGIKLKLAE